MKKDTTKLERHLRSNPTDANAVISLLKMKSNNVQYDFELERIKKRERAHSFARKRSEG